MEHRSFTPEHFRIFHPGGKLGAKLLKVRDLMHTDLPLIQTDTPMSEALLAISRHGFGVVGVTGPDGALQGIITDGDLRRHMDGLLSYSAEQVMTRNPRTVRPDALAEVALAAMNDRKITCLFVKDGQQANLPALGILHIHDLLRAGVV
jgi:arabinose-5-phosphate isomerase